MPEMTNSNTNPITKAVRVPPVIFLSLASDNALAATRIDDAATMAAKQYMVILPPPILSASLPPYGRLIEPRSGPIQAIWAAARAGLAAPEEVNEMLRT